MNSSLSEESEENDSLIEPENQKTTEQNIDLTLIKKKMSSQNLLSKNYYKISNINYYS